jgi:hypothetical protein
MVRFRHLESYNRGAMRSYRFFSLQADRPRVSVHDEIVDYPRLAELIGGRLASQIDAETVMMPLLNRNERADVAAWLDGVHAYPVAPGTVVLSEDDPRHALHRRGYAEILLAASHGFVLQPGKRDLPDLTFRYERPNASAADLDPLLRLYPFLAPDLPKGEFPAALEVSIPAADLAAWYDSPRQRTTSFYRAISSVSMSVQRTLRRWLRFAWFADLQNFDDLLASRAMMMYWLSCPCKGRSRSDFTWDVLSQSELNRLYAFSTARANRELKNIHWRLSQPGRDLPAHSYRSLHRSEIVAAVRREGRTLNRLLALESDLVDTLSRMAPEAAASPVSVFDFALRYVHEIRFHLRKEPLPVWSHDLAVLVLIHATTALRASMGLPSGIRARLVADSRVFEANPRENLAEPLPLAS